MTAPATAERVYTPRILAVFGATLLYFGVAGVAFPVLPRLVERGWVTEFDDWRHGKALASARPPLAEADRVASIIIDRWLKTPPSA